MATKKKATKNFEQSLTELQALVERMESGQLSLEESLTDFEKGISLTRDCQRALIDAEQKVKVLLEKNGETQTIPFELDEK